MNMGQTTFRFDGAQDLTFKADLQEVDSLNTVQQLVSNAFAVVKPEGLSFWHNGDLIDDLADLKGIEDELIIKVDGHSIRPVPGPTGLPIFGNYFEVFPDHLGNNQRLFDKYGPIFQTNNMGNVVCQTNDPELAQICFGETDFFSKEIVPSHPLYPIKNPPAGVFLGDTKTDAWKVVHKFLPPALGPKAVRHYAPQMNKCCDESLPVFDELESQHEAWNVYQYMLKLSSGTIGKIMLSMDFEHFSKVDAPLHPMVLNIAQVLVLNKRISSRGEWYSHLPFGDPARLKQLQADTTAMLDKIIKENQAGGTEDLELQEAALKASNIIDYLVRATDSKGDHLPKVNLMSAVTVAAGAGFTTTSSLLSWCLYSLMTYPDTQARLLQELIDHDINDETDITAEQIDELPELAKFIKETQRRHNPSYQPARTAQKDVILPGGYQMKKGTVVVMALHHIHNNPAIWDNPHNFNPDRWDSPDMSKMHKASYIPFATGQRMCIGFNFALLEVKIFICKLVYRYHWEKEGEAQTEYDPEFQLIRPVNLYARTTKREAYPTKTVSG